MKSASGIQIERVPKHGNRARNFGAEVLGGLGIVLFCLGIAAMVIVGFVSSSGAAKSTVESALANSAIRDVIAEELVIKVEESADSPQEKIVFSIARPLIRNAVANALDKPRLRQAAGDIAAAAYSVFVEEEPATEVDIEAFVSTAIDAMKLVDSKIAKTFNPTIDPLELKRDTDSPDIKGIRDAAKTASRILLGLGLLLQVAAWFLSVADYKRKLRALGIRIMMSGVILFAGVFIARAQVPRISTDNQEVLRAMTQFLTAPIMVRAVVCLSVGLISALVGEFLLRRDKQTPLHLSGSMPQSEGSEAMYS